MLDPATSDGRVIFMLPWEGRTIAGTTDVACDVTDSPKPTEEDIRFILKEIQDYLSPDLNVRRKDVMSAWTGIRPLVSDPNAKNTEELSRDHIVRIVRRLACCRLFVLWFCVFVPLCPDLPFGCCCFFRMCGWFTDRTRVLNRFMFRTQT